VNEEPEISAADLYALLIEATAAEGCSYQPGDVRKLMVVVRAQSRDAALEEAMSTLSGNFWTHGQVLKDAPITNDMTSEPGYLQDAIWSALAHGAAIVVYDK
jgi:hypothetical protein